MLVSILAFSISLISIVLHALIWWTLTRQAAHHTQARDRLASDILHLETTVPERLKTQAASIEKTGQHQVELGKIIGNVLERQEAVERRVDDIYLRTRDAVREMKRRTGSKPRGGRRG